MQFLSSLKDKVEGAIDSAQDAIAARVCAALQPRVHAEIDGRVDAFRESSLEALPRQCESGLEAQAADSSVAWLLHKALAGSTDELVAKLVSYLRPGITSATDGLSSSATDQILALLKDVIDGSEPEAAAAAEQMRSLGVSGAEPAAPPPAGGEGEEPASGGFRAAAKGLVSGVVGLDGRMPSFEEAARALVHPLFVGLKKEIWELVPGTLQASLGDIVGERSAEVEANPAEAGVGDDAAVQASSGFSGWMTRMQDSLESKLAGRAGKLLDRLLAAALDAVDEPVQALVGRLVDELESSALEASFREIRAKLAAYKLISSA